MRSRQADGVPDQMEIRSPRSTMTPMRRSVPTLTGAVVLVVLVSACGRRTHWAPLPIVGGPPEQSSSNRFRGTPEAYWPDQAVARLVRDALIDQLGKAAVAKLDATVEHGIVLLSGEVDTLLAKQASVAAAEAIRGVRAVVNEIFVDLPRRRDMAVADDIRRALETNALRGWRGVDVTVNKGIVTLTGTVDSGQEKQVASALAAGVAGVIDVRNQMGVTPTRRRPDSEIVRDVQSRLYWALPIDSHFVSVQCANGRVTLSGRVATPADRNKALALSWMSGVRQIDGSRLVVDPGAFPSEPRPRVIPGASDASISTAVRDALFYDPRVPREVTVQVRHAVATLSGTPSTLSQKRAAIEDARDTTGVERVEDLMIVLPTSRMSDDEIAYVLKRALARDPVVDLQGLDVDVVDGEVLIRGRVAGELAHARALDIGSAVPGVRSIGDGIIVVSRQGLARSGKSGH